MSKARTLLIVLCAVAVAPAVRAAELSATVPACPPAATVEGPAEIVAPIFVILDNHGVATDSPSCGGRGVKASLAPNPGAHGYRLQVLDGMGRTNVRQVADAATAATLIESWAVGEDAEVWATHPGSNPIAADTTTAAPPTNATAPGPQLHVGAAGEASVSPDAAIWWGASAGGCVRVGAFCVGGRANIGRAETTLEIDRTLGIAPALTRTLGGMSALASWPVSSGRFWVAPSLGLGAAWLHAQATQAQATSTANDLLARAEAGAVAGMTIGGGWSLAIGLGVCGTVAIDGDARQGTKTYVPTAPRGFLTTGLGVWYAP